MKVIYICSEAFTLRSNNHNLCVATRYQCIYIAGETMEKKQCLLKELMEKPDTEERLPCHKGQMKYSPGPSLFYLSCHYSGPSHPHLLLGLMWPSSYWSTCSFWLSSSIVSTHGQSGLFFFFFLNMNHIHTTPCWWGREAMLHL